MKEIVCKFCGSEIKWVFDSVKNDFIPIDVNDSLHNCDEFKKIRKNQENKSRKKEILNKFKDTGGSLDKVIEFVEKNKLAGAKKLKEYLKSKGIHPYIRNKAVKEVFANE